MSVAEKVPAGIGGLLGGQRAGVSCGYQLPGATAQVSALSSLFQWSLEELCCAAEMPQAQWDPCRGFSHAP